MPLPPGTKIVIELDRSEDEFVILTPKTDPEKYKLKLLNVCLYMPIAQLSQSVYQEFSALWTKPKDLQSGAVNIHYRRSEIRTISIASNAQEFNSDVLFSDEAPCRLVFVLVDTAAKNGSYSQNPFEFRRKWYYKLKKKNLNVPQENLTEKELWERRISDIEKESERRIAQIQERFELLQAQLLANDKGKGRGKKVLQQSQYPQECKDLFHKVCLIVFEIAIFCLKHHHHLLKDLHPLAQLHQLEN